MIRFPDFFIIGAMKAGSTSLWHMLRTHPDLYLCNPKEPQFFSHRKGWSKGVSWYSSLFADAPSGALCGEASTCYSRYPHYGDVTARIAKANSRARFIYILRDPVSRCYSHYLHDCQERAMGGKPILSFRESWRQNAEYLDASRYIEQIDQYLRCFDRGQFFLCTIDELKTCPDQLYSRLCEFLSIDPARRIRVSEPRVENESLGEVYARMVGVTSADALLRRFAVPSQIRRLAPLPIRQGVRRMLTKTVAALRGGRAVEQLKQQISPLTGDDRGDLLAHLRDSIERLQDWWSRDLATWLSEEVLDRH
jgi:hypothetical protein